ncbi:hypothetical protein SO802_019375 [Lithocarpus litseifolius]|uniref:PGG domain-containing protein n=1 Tax=Lithocarpus litseifolius TaxID=425828 RepID=A0AAW2CQJ1_9ROSI
MDERIQRLNGIAQQGDIDAFYNIIREDVKLLEHIDEFPFIDTPLHISASAGNFPFSREMMILKPSFINKRNPDGYTPIYLALLNGHTEMVRQLLQHNADLVRVKGRECMTPLHYAATKIGREGLAPSSYKEKTKDYLALLENFLSVCPDSITDVTTRNETALHIALKNNNLEAFKFLVGWLLRKWPYWRKILEQKDVEGNTVLHIAAVSHLLKLGRRFVNIEKNLGAKTALDILDEQRRRRVDNSEMRDILERAGALAASSLPTVTSSYAHYLRLPRSCERVKIMLIGNQVMKGMTDARRNALLVVVALLVTVTYQAILSPPGGLWQDDLFEPNTTDVLRRSPDDLYKLNITGPHGAGSATARRTDAFAIFMTFNSILFLSSIVTMAVLVPPYGIVGANLVGVSVYLCFGYFSSLMIITQAPDWLVRMVLISPLFIIIVGAALFVALKYLGYMLNLKRKKQRAHLDREEKEGKWTRV